MKIEISLDTKDAADLAALMALVGSLGGKAPTVVNVEWDGKRIYDPRDAADEPEGGISTGTPAPILADANTQGQTIDPPAPDQYASMPNPEGAPDVDSRGLPWDERIHASTKATNGDGSWRNKRGVDKALLEAVEAELGAVPNAPDAPAATASGAADVAGASEGNATGPTATNDAGTGAATTAGTSASIAPAAGEIPLPPAPAAEEAAGTIPDAPAAPTPADAPTFKDAMAIVTTRQREGTLTQVQVSEAAQALGLSSVVDLAKPANAEHIAAFIALLG